MGGLSSSKRVNVERAKSQRARKATPPPRDRLPHQDRAFKSEEPLQTCKPKKSVGFTRLPLAAFALEHRPGDAKSAVDVECQNVDVRQNIAPSIRVDANGDP